ncbi:hypothetical protein LX36DRAFT_650654 [Colletotrichum falcatum]|nr:hypothetical protein LX36DRAFT_650654 [Colletotrichum falcatum]
MVQAFCSLVLGVLGWQARARCFGGRQRRRAKGTIRTGIGTDPPGHDNPYPIVLLTLTQTENACQWYIPVASCGPPLYTWTAYYPKASEYDRVLPATAGPSSRFFSSLTACLGAVKTIVCIRTKYNMVAISCASTSSEGIWYQYGAMR